MPDRLGAAAEVRVGLIGSGRMAAVHAANLERTPGARLVAVAGGSGAAAMAARHRAEVRSPADVFDARDLDAIVIASPNRVHAEQIERAAVRDRAVLVEKPVDLDLARVDACIAAVGAGADRVVVAFNRRFDPSFAELRARVAAGRIGSLRQLTIVSRDPAPPPLEYLPGSGGLFRDMTIHDLDMVRFVAGEVATVQATAVAADPAVAALGDATDAMLTLTTRDGALVSIANARSNPTGYDQRLEAVGPLGAVAVGNPSPVLVRTSNEAGVEAADPWISFYGDRYEAAYAAEIAHLVEVARGQQRPRASLADGRAALVLALAAAEAARTGRAVTVPA